MKKIVHREKQREDIKDRVHKERDKGEIEIENKNFLELEQI